MRLQEIMSAEQTVANRDSAIQRFEFTYELSWKSLKRYLQDQGIVALTPRACFMEAFRIGIISDDEQWIRMGKDRNMTVHTYDETFAQQVYERIRGYLPLFEKLEKELEQRNTNF